MNTDEIVSWKRIDEFPQYEVSNTGLVQRGAKVKKCRANSHGYPTAVLCESGKRKNIPVHRLVAIAFIPNPDNLPQVNHKDENKQNNNVANLEWCDAKYNNNYSNAAGRAFDYKSIPVVMLTFDGAVHSIFPGSASASRQTGIGQGNINEVCMGKRASAGGYVFRYASDFIQELQGDLMMQTAEYGIDGKTMLTLAKSQIKTAQDNIKLQEQLAESQRMADAAVEDLNSYAATCLICSNVDKCDHDQEDGCFVWRGPQAGEGEAQ